MKKILILLAVLTLCAAAVAPLAIRFAKNVRAEQHLQSAQDAYEAAEYDEAFRKLQSAGNLAPDNLEVERLLGPFANKINHRRALDWWLEAASEGLLDPDSVKDMIAHAHETGQFEAAGPFLEKALEDFPKDEELRTQQLAYLQYQRKDLEAFHLARSLLQEGILNPVVRSYYLFLSFTLPQISKEYESESIRFLKEFARDDNPDGLTALRILLDTWPRLDQASRDFVSSRLANHPNADLLDHLHILARKAQRTLTRQGALEAAFELYANIAQDKEVRIVRAGADMDSTAEAVFADWLNQQGFHEACVQFVQDLDPELNQSLSFARIMALIKLGKVDQASQFILSTETLTLLQKLYLRVLSLERQGKQKEREGLLELMVSVVDSSEVDWLEPILLLRERNDLVIEMYQRLEQTLQDPFPAQMKLLQHYYRQGKGSALTHLTKKLDPANLDRLPVQKSLLLYLQLITKQDVEKTRREMEKLVAAFPGIIDYRILLALAYAVSGETEEAGKLLNSFATGLIPDRRNLLVGAAYVHQQNNSLTRARDIFARIDPEQLMPLERALLRQLL